MAISDTLLKIIPFNRRPKDGGISRTPTFNESSPNTPLSQPTFREHLEDVFTTRTVNDSRALMKTLFKQDPDVSAAVNAFVTVANTSPWWICYAPDGTIDREANKAVDIILRSIFTRNDYTKPNPFELRLSMLEQFEEMRYMLLLRGAIANELLVDKTLLPNGIRQVDASTLEWTEKKPGSYTIEQVVGNNRVKIDTPTFFVNFFRRDPTGVYTSSFFVSSINTIAARQQVINDLYRIMTKTGYPRMAAKVLEEVLRKNMPANIKGNLNEENTWIRARMQEITNTLSSLRADQTFVHMDSVEPYVINEKNPAAQLDISKVVDVLNDSNQAALKVMSTVIGRGDKGVNTASVEARLFALNAEALNGPLAAFMSQMLTFAVRLHGIESQVEFGFDRVELRPDLELEPQKQVRQTRLLELLSHGIIDDDEFHVEMFNRPRPDHIPELSGTDFLTPAAPAAGSDISPNADPLGRSLSPKPGSSKKPKQ